MQIAFDSLERALPWAVALPLLAATVNAFYGRRLSRHLVAGIACAAMLADFALACCAFAALRQAPAGTVLHSANWAWLDAAALHVGLRLQLDALSVTMWLIVTGVGSLIHLFSWSYQYEEPGFARYFSWLNFFVAAMLLLVLADALPAVFIGWEGVGLASYALIGFSYENLQKARAGKKAFVVNRIGDVGFLLAMFVLFASLGTLDYGGMRASLTAHGISEVALCSASLLLALAATGKSAQLPLFVWLPDAMAGPTPVSALIHAATMVTAGIYLLARMGFLLALCAPALCAIAVVGACTALLAALMALAQTDLKKGLAYSTISQLGYMFMAIGLGAAPLGLFHVTTHAMFKACLFLSAGAVIHVMAGEQDMRAMGGLFYKVPRIAWPALVCTLAIAGVPPLSGFISKDAILGHAFALGMADTVTLGRLPWLCYGIGLFTAFLTAIYMGRLFLMTFASGPCRAPAPTLAHLHDAPVAQAWPLWLLAGCAAVFGGLMWPAALGGEENFRGWLEGAMGGQMLLEVPALPHSQEALLLLVSATVALCGLGVAWRRYGRALPAAAADSPFAAAKQASQAGLGIDAAYGALFVRPFDIMAHDVLRLLERRISNGLMQATGFVVQLLGYILGLFHNGNLQRYIAIFAIATAVLLWSWLLPIAQTLASALSKAGL